VSGVFEARELTLRSRSAFARVHDVLYDFEWGLNDVCLDDLRAALLLAADAAARDADEVRRRVEEPRAAS